MFAAQDGNKQAYGQLLSEIQPVLTLFVKQRVSSAADGDDIVQEIMMGLHRNRHTFNGESSFEAWMFSIARFKLIDYIRKKKRKSENETTTEEVIEGSVPAEHFQDAEAVETLKAALGKLPEKQRLIVEAMKFRGESVKDVADDLSMSEAAVRVNAHRAYKKIKAALLGDDSNDET